MKRIKCKKKKKKPVKAKKIFLWFNEMITLQLLLGDNLQLLPKALSGH